MHFLLFVLFLISPSHIDGLLCVANGKYENDIGKFTDALYQLANETVDNTIIKRCQVTIILNNNDQRMIIEYFGDNINNHSFDSLTLFTESLLSTGISITSNMLTLICSSNDYCDRQYIENWSQWLFNINFTKFGNDIHQFFQSNDNNDYSSSICYNDNQINNCSSRICYHSNSQKQTIKKCLENNQIPFFMQPVVNSGTFFLAFMKMFYITIETTILMKDFGENVHNIDQHQLNHNISYFCSFNQCNNQDITTGLINEINIKYNIKHMMDFYLSMKDQTTFKQINYSISTTNPTTFSTSTKMTNNVNRFSLHLFIFFINYSFKLIFK